MGRDDAVDPIIRRRRRAREAARDNRNALILGVAVVAALAVGVLFVLPAATGPRDPDSPVLQLTGPRAGKEGVEWDHKELLAYLDGEGLQLASGETGTDVGGTAWAYLYTPKAAPELQKLSNEGKRWKSTNLPGVVLVCKYASPQAAKDQAGVLTEPGFAWGCFTFQGADRGLLDAIRRHLT